MGMYVENNVIVGVSISREDYEEEFGSPYLMDEEYDNDLVAIGGAEKQWNEIVLGVLVEKLDCGGRRLEAIEPTDLLRVYDEKVIECRKQLEELGLKSENAVPKLYLVGQFR